MVWVWVLMVVDYVYGVCRGLILGFRKQGSGILIRAYIIGSQQLGFRAQYGFTGRRYVSKLEPSTISS